MIPLQKKKSEKDVTFLMSMKLNGRKQSLRVAEESCSEKLNLQGNNCEGVLFSSTNEWNELNQGFLPKSFWYIAEQS